MPLFLAISGTEVDYPVATLCTLSALESNEIRHSRGLPTPAYGAVLRDRTEIYNLAKLHLELLPVHPRAHADRRDLNGDNRGLCV
jgi:hypothetical protein